MKDKEPRYYDPNTNKQLLKTSSSSIIPAEKRIVSKTNSSPFPFQEVRRSFTPKRSVSVPPSQPTSSFRRSISIGRGPSKFTIPKGPVLATEIRSLTRPCFKCGKSLIHYKDEERQKNLTNQEVYASGRVNWRSSESPSFPRYVRSNTLDPPPMTSLFSDVSAMAFQAKPSLEYCQQNINVENIPKSYSECHNFDFKNGTQKYAKSQQNENLENKSKFDLLCPQNKKFDERRKKNSLEYHENEKFNENKPEKYFSHKRNETFDKNISGYQRNEAIHEKYKSENDLKFINKSISLSNKFGNRYFFNNGVKELFFDEQKGNEDRINSIKNVRNTKVENNVLLTNRDNVKQKEVFHRTDDAIMAPKPIVQVKKFLSTAIWKPRYEPSYYKIKISSGTKNFPPSISEILTEERKKFGDMCWKRNESVEEQNEDNLELQKYKTGNLELNRFLPDRALYSDRPTIS